MTHARSKYIMDMTGWRAEVTFYSYPVVIFAFSRRWYTLDFPSPLNRAWIFAWTSLRRGQLATTVFGGDLPWRELEIKRKIGHSEEWLVNCYLFLSLSFSPPFFPSFFYFFPFVSNLAARCKKMRLWILALGGKVRLFWQDKLTLNCLPFCWRLR